MNVALELVPLHGRSRPRVYHALAWVCVRARRNPMKRLAAYARLLGLRAEEARELEAEARADRSVRIGRDPMEQRWLHQALSELARAHPTLAAVASILVKRVAPAARRPSPFEESQVGPPIVMPRWSA